MKHPACSAERIVETYRDHTRSAQRSQHYGPLVPKSMTLTGKLAWCAFYASITGVGIGLCLYFAGEM